MDLQQHDNPAAGPASGNAEGQHEPHGVMTAASLPHTRNTRNTTAESHVDVNAHTEPAKPDPELVAAQELNNNNGVHIVDYNYVDHFSLRGPSSMIRFRGARVQVYDQSNDQFILEDRVSATGAHSITVKRMRNGSFGLRFLRVAYTLVALLMLGFLFVFCFQIILFVFLNLPLAGGATSAKPFDASQLIGTVLSTPLFAHAMGSIMAMATAFVSDTWNGHPLFQNIMNWSSVMTEWLCFILYLAIPVITMCVTLLAGNEDWWEISALTWMITVLLFFVLFCMAVVVRELRGCLELINIQDTGRPASSNTPGAAGDDDDETKQWRRWRRLIQKAILLAETHRYSGTREERYQVSGSDEYPIQGFSISSDHTAVETRTGLYTKLTQFRCLNKVFDTIDPPTRNYSLEEIRDIVPFVTDSNWSLERMFCRNRNARVVFVVRGPNALEQGQIISNLICTTIGIVLGSLLVIGLLVWIQSTATTVIVVTILIAVFAIIPVVRSSLDNYRTLQNIRNIADMEEAANQQDTSLYQVWETVTVTKPRPWYCWTRASLEVIFLFLWPVITLFSSNNVILGVLFLILGFFSGLRIYFDASWVLSELGSVDGIDLTIKCGDTPPMNGDSSHPNKWNLKSITSSLGGHSLKDKAHRELLAKARMSEVVGKISRTRSVTRWMWFYALFAVIATMMVMMAADTGSTTPDGGRPPIVTVDDFYYPPQPNLPYPSCEMTKGFQIPGHGSSSLADYAFLAALSYETPNITQYQLNTYFGENSLIDETEFVAQYRQSTGTASNPVYFKLFSFPSIPGYGIVSIRGSETTWDFLVDAQLWSAAFLVQAVRALIPLGWIWTPILDQLVTAVTWIEGENLKQVSYYKVTTGFINGLLENNYTSNGLSFNTLRVTGASLGGGLAIISGAQTRANAVAISGLNGELSRHTFQPPLTTDQLNQRVFNVIPDRDIIARTGGRSRLFQEIECRAPKSNLLGCHSMWRSVCELSYTCGTAGRPVFCKCVQSFGYPEPIPNGTRTFTEACNEEANNLAVEFPDGTRRHV